MQLHKIKVVPKLCKYIPGIPSHTSEASLASHRHKRRRVGHYTRNHKDTSRQPNSASCPSVPSLGAALNPSLSYVHKHLSRPVRPSTPAVIPHELYFLPTPKAPNKRISSNAPFTSLLFSLPSIFPSNPQPPLIIPPPRQPPSPLLFPCQPPQRTPNIQRNIQWLTLQRIFKIPQSLPIIHALIPHHRNG